MIANPLWLKVLSSMQETAGLQMQVLLTHRLRLHQYPHIGLCPTTTNPTRGKVFLILVDFFLILGLGIFGNIINKFLTLDANNTQAYMPQTRIRKDPSQQLPPTTHREAMLL